MKKLYGFYGDDGNVAQAVRQIPWDNNRLRLRLGSAIPDWPLFRREQSVMVQTTTGGFIRLADIGENQINGCNRHQLDGRAHR